MFIVGFKSGKEITVNAKMTSLKVRNENSKLSSIHWEHGVDDKEKLKWFDIDSIDYIIEKED
jgi:hypothetical protein